MGVLKGTPLPYRSGIPGVTLCFVSRNYGFLSVIRLQFYDYGDLQVKLKYEFNQYKITEFITLFRNTFKQDLQTYSEIDDCT